MSTLNIVADQNMLGLDEYLGAFGSVKKVDGRQLGPGDLLAADVLLVRSVTPVDEGLLENSPVQFVGTATSGFEHVDRAYLAARGIGFAHAPGSNANSVVEYVLAVIACESDYLEHLLDGSPLGIVGYGHIGKALASRCKELGVNYLVYDPWLEPDDVDRHATLREVLSCRVVTFHAEMTQRDPWPSFHLLDQDRMALLAPDALLINASRGGVVDNASLAKRLRDGCGPIAVLDVWEGEPLIDHDLLRLLSLGTAHIAGYSTDGKLLATRMLRDAFAQHLGKRVPPNLQEIPPAEVLRVPRDLEGAGLLRWALTARYDPRTDDKLLREQTLGRSPGDAGVGFDTLRKNYRERRELAGSILHVEPGNPEQVRSLRALGCRVE